MLIVDIYIHCLPYLGKAFSYDKDVGIGTTIIKEMSKGHENKNFHFTFDNYYSNIYTFLYLNNKNIEFTCTFSQKRKYFPKKIKELELEKGESKLYNIKNTETRLFFLKD